MPCADESAYTTARLLVSEIIANYGKVDFLLSDKGPGFMSRFFSVVNQLLSIKHKTSASMAKRSNGLTERKIRELNQRLKLYCDADHDDRHIEQYLPLIELSQHASANPDSGLSPFFILHGFDMPVPIPHDVIVPDAFHSRSAQQWACWLKNAIKTVHDTVRQSKIASKVSMKQDYDRRHRAKTPDFKVGDQVLLLDTRIATGTNKILTKRPYHSSPYLIREIVQSQGSGPAYRIADKTGKEIRGLITYDRLKHFQTSKTESETTPASTATVRKQPHFEKAVKILQDGIIAGEQRFLVLFRNKQQPHKTFPRKCIFHQG